MANNDREIENAVSNMLERYGADTLKEIDLRIMELESRNQIEAAQLWRAIRERVEVLADTSIHGTLQQPLPGLA
jgi:Fic family protein